MRRVADGLADLEAAAAFGLGVRSSDVSVVAQSACRMNQGISDLLDVRILRKVVWLTEGVSKDRAGDVSLAACRSQVSRG